MTARAVGAGSSGGLTGFGIWRYRTATGSNPSSGQLQFDDTTIDNATELYINATNDGGTDMTNFLNLLESGDLIYIQVTNDASEFVVCEIGTPSLAAGVFTFPLTNVEGQGSTPNNNSQVSVVTTVGGTTPTPTPTLQQVYDVSSSPEILLDGVTPLELKNVSNTSLTTLKLTAEPLATPNIPAASVEFYAPIDLITAPFNSGRIVSGFVNGSGFDKGYLTLSSPQTVGVWNDVFCVRNSRAGLGGAAVSAVGPLCGFHTDTLPAVIRWSDSNNRNTAQYHQINITPGNLSTGLSGLFGVDTGWTGGNSSGRSVNSTFYLFTVGDANNFAGGFNTCMVGQYSINSSGLIHNVVGAVGMQGKIHFTNAFATTLTASLGHTAIEAFLQGQAAGPGTVDLLNSFKARCQLHGVNIIFDTIRGLHVENPTGTATLVNHFGIWIDALNFATTLNMGIVLDGDSQGSDIFFGGGQDACLYYDGTDFIIDPDIVGTGRVLIGATGNNDMLLNNIEIDGDLNHDGAGVGFYGTAPIAKQLAVPVTAAGVHAALVALGLIT